MKNLKVKDILRVTKGRLICGNEEYECINYTRDTRIIKKGDTYIAIKGENFDGNLFWKEAFENGAEVVILSGIEISKEDIEKYKDKTIIIVEDGLKALYEIAKEKRNMYDIPVIAITGSVGKTSTKDIVANVVSKKYKTLKTLGNNNNNIGLPFTILRLQDEEAMVLEMGMNHFGEIKLLSEIARPDICIITNIGTSHIGNLGSRENILKAKLEILEGNQKAKLVINNDNDLLHKWYEDNKNKKDIITFGIKEKSNIMGENISFERNIGKYTFEMEGRKIIVPIGGEHFVLNSLCAIAVGKLLNIDLKKIAEGIESFELTKRRMEITDKKGIKVINDAYNASYESMQASLKSLSEYENYRKIAILGDMFELGDYSEELHRKVGMEVKKNNIDILICSGENSKYIIDDAIKNGMDKEKTYYLDTQDEIIDKVREIIKANDIVLIKASHGMKFYELADKIIENI